MGAGGMMGGQQQQQPQQQQQRTNPIIGGYQIDRQSGRRCYASEQDCVGGPNSCSMSGNNRCQQGGSGPCANTVQSVGSYTWFCPQ